MFTYGSRIDGDGARSSLGGGTGLRTSMPRLALPFGMSIRKCVFSRGRHSVASCLNKVSHFCSLRYLAATRSPVYCVRRGALLAILLVTSLAAGVSVAESVNEIDDYPRLAGSSGDDVDRELLTAAGLPLLPSLPVDYNYVAGDELPFRMQTALKPANVASDRISGSSSAGSGESSDSPLSSEQSTIDVNCIPDISTPMPTTSKEPGGDSDGVASDTRTFGAPADKIRAVRLWHGLQVRWHCLMDTQTTHWSRMRLHSV